MTDRRGRAAAIIGAATLLALVVCLLAPLVGVENGRIALLDLRDVASGIFGESNLSSRIFVVARLPRALAGALVGAGLAGAGCAFQAVLRNPLAEPYTLGVSSGASLAAVLAIRFGLDASPIGASAIGLSALVGSALTVALVWRLARIGRALPPGTLLLAGVTVALICSAASLVVQYTASFAEVYRIVRWMMGGLDWIRYGPLVRAAVPVAIGVVVLLRLARDLNALAAGADAAASVGVDVGRAVATAFIAASLIVGATISVAGPVGFVGLIVPHALRGVVGPDHRVLLPASMAVGGAFVVACDTAARIVLSPAQLPVGVITAVLGGPFFLYLLVREKERGRY